MSAPSTNNTPSTRTEGAPTARRLSAFLYRHDRLRLAGLLTPPVLWLVVLYLGSLGVMLVSSFWSVDSFTGDLVKKTTTANYHILFTQSVYRTVALRTVGIALGVTVIDLLLALPLALFISKVVRSRRVRYALLIMVTMPLWASYLVKGYAWRIMFDKGGVIDWVLSPLGAARAGSRPHGDGRRTCLLVAALHGACRSTPVWSDCRRRCLRRPPTSARPRRERCDPWCCRC